MGETPAIKQRVHFAGSNLAFKQYAKVCFLGTILLLGFFFHVTMQNMGYSHYSLALMMAKWKEWRVNRMLPSWETLHWVFVGERRCASSGMAVLDCRLATTQQGVLLVSAVSGRYLSSQLAFRLNAKPTWAKGGASPLHALSPPSPYPLWGYTIPSSH